MRHHHASLLVPLIVAVNKCDVFHEPKYFEKVKLDLMKAEVVAESLGGEVQVVPVSAKTGAGMAALLDALLAEADILDALWIPDPKSSTLAHGPAYPLGRGTILESR